MKKHSNILTRMSLTILSMSLLVVNITHVDDAAANSAGQKIVMACSVSQETPVGKWLHLIYAEAFTRLGIEFECPFYPPKRASNMADEGMVDGEPARAAYYAKDHSNLIRLDVPVGSVKFTAFATNSTIQLDGWESLRKTDYRVEYLRGIKACEEGLPDVVSPDKLSAISRVMQGLKRLAAGRIDIFVHLEADVMAALRIDEFKDFGIQKAGVMEQQIAYPYLHKKHQELVPKLETVLKEMRKEGLIEKYQDIAFMNSKWVSRPREITLFGDEGYPPYSYSEGDKAKGIYVEVLTKIFEKIEGYEVKFKMLPWKRCIKLVKDGKSIAFFPPYYTEERETWMVFSEPILQEQTIVFGKAEKLKGKTKWPEYFYNHTFGLNAGFNPEAMAGKKFSSAVQMGMIKINEAKNNESNLKKLAKDRLDFYINDKLIDISSFPDIKRGIVAKNNWGYLGFTRKDFEYSEYLNDFKIKFNKAVKKTKETDEIQKIINSYTK